MSVLADFHFLQPQWLYAMLALPLFALIARHDPAQRALSRLVDPALLPHLLQGQPRRRAAFAGLAALGWALAAFALAGPSWNRIEQPLFGNRAAQVVALSLSQHMLAQDVKPSRMDRARYKAQDLFDANKDGLNGLLAYAGEAFVVAPLTSDANSLTALLTALAPDTMPVDGNNAAEAIRRGAAMIEQAHVSGGSLVLVTDQVDEAAISAAQRVHAAGIDVSVLGIGTPQGGAIAQPEGGFVRNAQGGMDMAPRQDSELQALAQAGGGIYVPMSDDNTDIHALAGELKLDHKTTAVSGMSGDDWQDRGPWLLLLLLPVVALLFRRGWLLLLPLVLLPLWPAPAQAQSWSQRWADLWRTPDQQAAKALANGKPAQAMQQAQNPALRGAAAYRDGKFAQASSDWQNLPGADAQYNTGNALARDGKYQEAIAAYDRALKADPHHADAKANRDAVEAWLKQQPPQQQPKQHPSSPKDNKQSGASSKPQDQQGDNAKQDKKDDASSGSQQQDKPQDQQGQQDKPQDGKDSNQQGQGEPKPQTEEEKAAEQQRAEAARQALQQQMDQQLKQGDKQDQAHDLARAANSGQDKLPDDLRRSLQHVPDDPGGLLRRKFDIEYRERHGVPVSEDDQP